MMIRPKSVKWSEHYLSGSQHFLRDFETGLEETATTFSWQIWIDYHVFTTKERWNNYWYMYIWVLVMFHKVDRMNHLVWTMLWLILIPELTNNKTNPTKKYWMGFGQMSSFITSPNSSPASCSVNQQKKLCGSWWPRFLPFNMFCWLYRWVRSCIET